MNVAPALYALALVQLMDQQDVHHFEIDLDSLDPEKSRGLSIDIIIEGNKMIVATGRCDCAKCAASAGTQ